MSRHSDEYNPMLDDYNDPEFNSYTSQGFKTTKSSKSGGLIDRAQNPTYELHISRIPIGNFFYIFLLFVLLFSKQVYKVSFVILTFVIDFTELGLQNIFGQYGTVVKTFLCRPKLVIHFKKDNGITSLIKRDCEREICLKKLFAFQFPAELRFQSQFFRETDLNLPIYYGGKIEFRKWK